MSAQIRPIEELVPIAERQRYLLCYRLLLVVVLGGAFLAWPSQAGLKWTGFGLVSAAYLAVSVIAYPAWRLRRSLAITVFGGTLLVDGLYLAITTYGSAGFGSPLQYLMLAHLVTITLLASFRTGLKVALWHTLLLASVFELERGKVLHPIRYPVSGASWAALCTSAGLVLVVTMVTATFAAVNERELRRRNYDLHCFAGLAQKLEASLSPSQVVESLIATFCDDLGLSRALVVAGDAEHLTLLAGRGTDEPTPTSEPESDRVIRTVMSNRKTVLLNRLDPDEEPWLASVLPDAANLVICALFANGISVGVAVSEYPADTGLRIRWRTTSNIERCVSHAALALSSAWLLDRINALAATDPLTGIANRRSFEQALKREIAAAQSQSSSLACLMIDIDHFKEINDRFGHQAGDDVLKAVAGAIAGKCKASEIVARYGGEEFVVILPAADEERAVELAEEMRRSVEDVSRETPISVSIGVAAYVGGSDAPEGLVDRADTALYRAKRGGRNRVVTAARSGMDLVRGSPEFDPPDYKVSSPSGAG